MPTNEIAGDIATNPSSQAIEPQVESVSVKSGRTPDRRLNIAVAALLLVLAFGFMLSGLPPWRVAAPMQYLLGYAPWHSYFPANSTNFMGGDLLLQQLPWRQWEQDELFAGRFPLWASTPAGGMPLFASAQPGVLFPLHLLWVLMPVGAGLGIIEALKLWLAGLGMYVFLRAIKLHLGAVLLGTLGFMFSTSLVNWLTWEQSDVILLLPWLVWGVYAWYEQKRRIALAALSVTVGSAILAGHPELLFIAGVTTGVWTLGLLLSDRAGWSARLVKLQWLLLSITIGVLLGSIQLLPFLEVLPISHQGVARQASMASAQFHLRIGFLLDWLVPRSQGYLPDSVVGASFGFTEANAYVGLVALVGLLLLAIAAIRRQVRWKLALPWVVIGIIAGVIAYTDIPGKYIRMLLIFNQSINVRWIIVLGFAVIVAGAIGWDWLARLALGEALRWQKRSVLYTGSLALLGLGLVILVVHALRWLPAPVLPVTGIYVIANDQYLDYWAIWTGGMLLSILGAAGLWLTSSGERGRQYAVLILSALLVTDLWTLLLPINPTSPAYEYYPQSSFEQQVKSIVPPTERIAVEGEVMPANTGLLYNIRDWRAGDPMISDRAYRVLHLLSPDMAASVYDDYNVFMLNMRRSIEPLLGMQYYIFPATVDPNSPGEADAPTYTRLALKNGLGLWRAEGVPGFVYLSDNIAAVSSGDAAFDWLSKSSWQTTRSYAAVVESQNSAISTVQHDPNGSSPGNVQVEGYTPGHILLKANAIRPSLLVVAESWYPGWEATIDGQPAQILRANYLSQGIVVPQGTHTIEMNYNPVSFKLGAAGSIAGLLGIAGLVAWARRERGRSASIREA